MEAEEYKTYTARMPEEWRAALAPLGTDYVKAHLTDAPWVIMVFREKYGLGADGTRIKNDHTVDSASVAVGLLTDALHHAGLVTLTHTSNPVDFLSELLGRLRNGEALMVLPAGYPAPDATVPGLARRPLELIFQVDLGGAGSLPIEL